MADGGGMPNYRRAGVAGGMYFFTVVTERRAAILGDDEARGRLRAAVAAVRRARAFEVVAAVVLPDHLHRVWTPPPGDADFATRPAAIKATFSRAHVAAGGAETPLGDSRRSRGHRGVWQTRYWEHLIRDADDLHRHLDSIHYNPVKHGHARCPHAWPASSFHRFVREGRYAVDWCCQCVRPATPPPDLDAAGDP